MSDWPVSNTTLIHVITFNYFYFLKLLLLSKCRCLMYVSEIHSFQKNSSNEPSDRTQVVNKLSLRRIYHENPSSIPGRNNYWQNLIYIAAELRITRTPSSRTNRIKTKTKNYTLKRWSQHNTTQCNWYWYNKQLRMKMVRDKKERKEWVS
jgi:hypothetical protein